MQPDYIARPSQFNKNAIMNERDENDKIEKIYNSLLNFFKVPEKSNISIDEAYHYFQTVIVFVYTEAKCTQR